MRRRFCHIFNWFIAIALLTAGAATVQAGEWTVLKRSGRDYVTLRNVMDFYGLGQYQPVSHDFSVGTGLRRLRGRVGSAEFYINNLKFILSYPVEELNGEPVISRMDLSKVIEPVLRPSRIKNAEPVRTIILDPGHGGHDKGATNQYGSEKNYTLDVAKRAKVLLEQQGFRVVLTRNTDDFVSLGDRTRIANRYSNALFVSIHFNSGGSHASGLEVFTLAPRGVPSMAADGPRLSDLHECAGNKRDAENMALATATHAAMVGRSQLFDRGIKRARFVVIRDISIPGVLVEGGFLSNSGDARMIRTEQYRTQMAGSIVAAVNNYKRAVSSGPVPSLAKGDSVQLRQTVPPPAETATADSTASEINNEPAASAPSAN